MAQSSSFWLFCCYNLWFHTTGRQPLQGIFVRALHVNADRQWRVCTGVDWRTEKMTHHPVESRRRTLDHLIYCPVLSTSHQLLFPFLIPRRNPVPTRNHLWCVFSLKLVRLKMSSADLLRAFFLWSICHDSYAYSQCASGGLYLAINLKYLAQTCV